MKTVVIYETPDELFLYLADADMCKYEGIFANCVYEDPNEQALADELAEIEFTKKLTTQEAKQHILDGAELVNCGFMY